MYQTFTFDFPEVATFYLHIVQISSRLVDARGLSLTKVGVDSLSAKIVEQQNKLWSELAVINLLLL